MFTATRVTLAAATLAAATLTGCATHTTAAAPPATTPPVVAASTATTPPATDAPDPAVVNLTDNMTSEQLASRGCEDWEPETVDTIGNATEGFTCTIAARDYLFVKFDTRWRAALMDGHTLTDGRVCYAFGRWVLTGEPEGVQAFRRGLAAGQ